MSTPEPPSGPPAEAGSSTPAAPAEPGHRARNLAASLLGELTGQRKSGLTFAPLEPSGLSVERREATAAPEQSPPDADAPAPSAAGGSADEQSSSASAGTPGLAPPPLAPVAPPPEGRVQPERPAAPRLTAVPSGTGDDAPAASTTRITPATTAASPVPTVESDEDDDPLDRLTATATARSSEPAARREEPSTPAPAAAPPSTPAPAAASTPAPQQAAPQQAAAQQAPPRPAPEQAAPAAPAAAATLATQPSVGAQVRPTGGSGSSAADVRPAPFAYLAVAQHHTTPARATANGALDQAGQRISSRVDRALVRRAAQVTMEAASLLDACDVLDGRARAADATWTGEHHSPTEVREFEGAWGAFYDAQNALAQHVTS